MTKAVKAKEEVVKKTPKEKVEKTKKDEVEKVTETEPESMESTVEQPQIVEAEEPQDTKTPPIISTEENIQAVIESTFKTDPQAMMTAEEKKADETKIELKPEIIDGKEMPGFFYPIDEGKKIVEETKAEIGEIVSELSLQAKKWHAYLNLQKMSPETFLKKYPFHQFKQYVEEILAKTKK